MKQSKVYTVNILEMYDQFNSYSDYLTLKKIEFLKDLHGLLSKRNTISDKKLREVISNHLDGTELEIIANDIFRK